jgi:hypothetical protein
MSQLPGGAASAPPNIIYIIRHGEKPADPPAVAAGQTPPPPPPGPPFGVDFQGNQNPHSLLPRGWQRSGALAVLFDPAAGPLPAGLQIPGALLSPSYGNPDKTAGHRTYQTIQGLSDRLGLAIVSGYAEGDEPQLTSYVVSAYSGVVLICWEHHHIPALASSLIPKPASQRRYPRAPASHGVQCAAQLAKPTEIVGDRRGADKRTDGRRGGHALSTP